MSLYRDERDALRARLEQLERDLAEARADLDRGAIQKQLAALSAQVAEATAQVEGDRAALKEVAASIEKLQASIAPAAAPEQGADHPTKTSAGAAGSPKNTFIFMGAAAAVLAGAAIALTRSTPAPPPDPDAAVAGIPGAPHAVDPIALLPMAKEKAHAGMFLVSIEARYVGPNGRVDLRAPSYAGSITYLFGEERPPESAPDPSAPLGAPKPPRAPPRQSQVKIDIAGIRAELALFGLTDHEVPEPKCTLEDVWKAAGEAGAPEDAVAVITYKYDRLGALGLKSAGADSGAAWLFRIEDTDISLRVEDPSCKVTTKAGLPR